MASMEIIKKYIAYWVEFFRGSIAEEIEKGAIYRNGYGKFYKYNLPERVYFHDIRIPAIRFTFQVLFTVLIFFIWVVWKIFIFFIKLFVLSLFSKFCVRYFVYIYNFYKSLMYLINRYRIVEIKINQISQSSGPYRWYNLLRWIKQKFNFF